MRATIDREKAQFACLDFASRPADAWQNGERGREDAR